VPLEQVPVPAQALEQREQVWLPALEPLALALRVPLSDPEPVLEQPQALVLYPASVLALAQTRLVSASDPEPVLASALLQESEQAWLPALALRVPLSDPEPVLALEPQALVLHPASVLAQVRLVSASDPESELALASALKLESELVPAWSRSLASAALGRLRQALGLARLVERRRAAACRRRSLEPAASVFARCPARAWLPVLEPRAQLDRARSLLAPRAQARFPALWPPARRAAKSPRSIVSSRDGVAGHFASFKTPNGLLLQADCNVQFSQIIGQDSVNPVVISEISGDLTTLRRVLPLFVRHDAALRAGLAPQRIH